MDGGCDGGIDLRCRGDVRHKTISAAHSLARVRNSRRASCSIHARRPYCRRHSLTSRGSQFRFHGDGARRSARHEHQWSVAVMAVRISDCYRGWARLWRAWGMGRQRCIDGVVSDARMLALGLVLSTHRAFAEGSIWTVFGMKHHRDLRIAYPWLPLLHLSRTSLAESLLCKAQHSTPAAVPRDHLPTVALMTSRLSIRYT
ncbi:hypothetical protein HBI04_062050 [Parastagonospora nodorum]|nr:hypothetical protein HBH52_199580 [Parastagonospora nodorum]KAH4021402.1 hypothetical protein HBI09_177890 [Parastagonospora nodorum]KAH4062422.1 hypothetical protein HBH50_208710 [Parastagonospora nodorum]KAH4080733.1 hypothetical protein HBH48_207300 [Parastagonospora nodorum]KAH4269272.1 hypothetical protein HBI03_054400 [Parastagonospora nodorum]